MIVDLVTTEKDLEDLMLSSYPGTLFDFQIVKFKENGERFYGFSGLDYGELSTFLFDLIEEGYEFRIFVNKKAEEIENNRNFINTRYTS